MVDRWVWAIVAIAAGLLVGTIAGWIARNRLQRSTTRPTVQRLGNAFGAFLFWFFTVVGVMFALGVVSPETLRPIPRQILDYLPRVLAAGLIVIAGWGAAVVGASLLSAALSRATGRLEREFELGIRATIVALTVVLALAQLGVNITVIIVLVAAIALTIGAAATSVISHGSRQIAPAIAAGRYLTSIFEVGDQIEAGEFSGTVVAFHPATIELRSLAGEVLHAPYTRVLESGAKLVRGRDQ